MKNNRVFSKFPILKISAKILMIFLYFCGITELFARDINLDEMYIKKSSRNLKILAVKKLDTYQKINATFVDRDIIFAGWISGSEIIYIKEIFSTNSNYIYKYRLRNRGIIKLGRLNGAITIARISPNGRYLIIKRLIRNGRLMPVGELVILNISTGEISIKHSHYAFLDFSIPNEGNSILVEKKNSIIEKFLDTGIDNKLISREIYSDIVISSNPSIAYLSPDRKKVLIINGSGGNYNAKVIWNGKSKRLYGLSSSTEIFWIDNFSIVYRKGYTGNFSVVLHNIVTDKKKSLLKKSFNTNIFYSRYPEIISFLEEQVILLYSRSDNRIINTGIEGEDISFSPGGNKFISLLLKKLFIVNLNTLKKKRIELKRSWKSIFAVYNNLKSLREEFENQFSRQYIDRKILVYKKLAKI